MINTFADADQQRRNSQVPQGGGARRCRAPGKVSIVIAATYAPPLRYNNPPQYPDPQAMGGWHRRVSREGSPAQIPVAEFASHAPCKIFLAFVEASQQAEKLIFIFGQGSQMSPLHVSNE